MHAHDQYQIPSKKSKAGKKSIVSDVADFLLSRATCERTPWAVGFARKRCYRLMQDLITTWHAEGYLEKNADIFQKSPVFKECWERMQNQSRRGSDESCTLGDQDPFTKVGAVELHYHLYCMANFVPSRERLIARSLAMT
jgi:hypothetical protein